MCRQQFTGALKINTHYIANKGGTYKIERNLRNIEILKITMAIALKIIVQLKLIKYIGIKYGKTHFKFQK